MKQLAKKFGFSDDYFSVVKSNNPEKFNLILSFDENPEKSTYKYIAYLETLISKMEKILLSYECNTDYGKKLKKANIIKTVFTGQAYNSDCATVFRIRDDRDYFSIQLQTIERWKKIINLHTKATV